MNNDKRGWFVMFGPEPMGVVRINGAFARSGADEEKKLHLGDHVEKISGAGWRGHVVGFY